MAQDRAATDEAGAVRTDGPAPAATPVRGVPAALLRGILDDAATFPPGNAAVADMLQAREMYAEAWFAELLGAVVVRADRVDELVAALVGTGVAERATGPLPVTVTVPDGLAAVGEAVRGAGHRLLRPVAFEVPLGAGDADAELLRTVRAQVPAPAQVYVELSGGVDAASALPELARAGVRGKLRTGGTSATAFPAVEQVARFVHAAVAARVAFKATAGLHNAVRHRDEDTGFVHHGFLNLLAATAAAQDGADLDEVSRVVGSTDAQPLVQVLRGVGDERAAAVRRTFAGFGTGSTVEPVEDLAGLGLLERPGAGA